MVLVTRAAATRGAAAALFLSLFLGRFLAQAVFNQFFVNVFHADGEGVGVITLYLHVLQ